MTPEPSRNIPEATAKNSPICIIGEGVPEYLQKIDFSYAYKQVLKGSVLAPVMAFNVVEYVRFSMIHRSTTCKKELAAFALNILSGKYDGKNGRNLQEVRGQYDESKLTNKILLEKLNKLVSGAAGILLEKAVIEQSPRSEAARKLALLFSVSDKTTRPVHEFVGAMINALKNNPPLLDEAVFYANASISEYPENMEVIFFAGNAFYGRAKVNIYTGADAVEPTLKTRFIKSFSRGNGSQFEREDDLRKAIVLSNYASILIDDELAELNKLSNQTFANGTATEIASIRNKVELTKRLASRNKDLVENIANLGKEVFKKK